MFYIRQLNGHIRRLFMEWEKLLSLETQLEKEKVPEQLKDYCISEFEKDYQSIVSSVAFRRLQDKTQVFPLDKSDFVRTRLTHSIEVSTIARQLGVKSTTNKTKYLPKDFKDMPQVVIDLPNVLSCAGLLHDIGNPPFGHFGEVIIGEWFEKELSKDSFQFNGIPIREILNEQMKSDLKNFEGNAQALRILSKARNNGEGYDVNLSYGVLNTLIKYPVDSINYNHDDIDVKKHKSGYFYAERDIIETICNKTGTEIDGEYVRHPLVYLLEAADDIAYATADLEDALKKRYFTLNQFVEYFENQVNDIGNGHKAYSKELIDDLKGRMETSIRNVETDLIIFQKWMESVKQWLMHVVVYRFSRSYDDIMNGTYKYDLFHDTNHQETIKILKKIMVEFVYEDEEIVKLELSAKKIISSLLKNFVYAVLSWEVDKKSITKTDEKYINLISSNYKEDYKKAKTNDEVENLYLRLLMITDYISGMTDSYAKNLYQDLNGIN